MLRFLVACPCGQKLEVTAAQAGQRLPCACGREIDVPTLRGLQALERIGDDATGKAPRRWGARHGLIFLGATIVVVSLVLAVWLEFSRPRGLIVVERPSAANDHVHIAMESIESLANFQSLTPADVWLTWQITAPVGADPRYTTFGSIAAINETRWVVNWRDWRYLVWAIGGIGVLLIAGGLLLPQRKVRRRTAGRTGRAGASP